MNIDELLLPELKHLAKPLDKILLASDAILRLTEQYPTVDKIERVIKNSIGESPARATITKHLVDVKVSIAKQLRLANGISKELPEPVVSAFKILMDYGETVSNKNLQNEFDSIKKEREFLNDQRKKDLDVIENLKTQLLLAYNKHESDQENILELKDEIKQFKEKVSNKEETISKVIKQNSVAEAKHEVLQNVIDGQKTQLETFELDLENSKLQAREIEHQRDRLLFDIELLKKEKMDLKTKLQSDQKNAEQMQELIGEMSLNMRNQIKESTTDAFQSGGLQNSQEKSSELKFSLKRSSRKALNIKRYS